MYRARNFITINSNYYNINKLSYKSVACTAICASMPVELACQTAADIGSRLLEIQLRLMNIDYGIRVLSVKYSAWHRYKFKGEDVAECTATVVFDITYKGKPVGEMLSQGIVKQLIERNGGKQWLTC